jgi:hypothetical protein
LQPSKTKTSAGIGTSHQTDYAGLVADLIIRRRRS